MRKAGALTAEALDLIGPLVKPGVTTASLDRFAFDFARDHGALIPDRLIASGHVYRDYSTESDRAAEKLAAEKAKVAFRYRGTPPTPEQMARVACPVGIKIRSQSVPEIAVSIMAQFIEKRAELVGEKQVSTAAKVELV